MVWLAFRNEDWTGFGDRLLRVDRGALALYAVMFTIGHLTRIVRWGILVRALGQVSWREIMSAGAVGYMCIIVFPLRLGELVRPYLIRAQGQVTGSGTLATVVVERVIDGLLFVALFFIFISILPSTGDSAVDAVRYGGYVAGAVFVTALLVLIAGYLRRKETVAFIANVGNRVHRGLTTKVVRILDAFLDGLKILPDRRRIALFIALTFVYWGVLGLAMKVMGTAAHMPDLTYAGGFALLAVLVVGIMVPGGPGFTGTFEFALTAGFSLLALSPSSRENVVLYTIVLHSVQLVIQVGLGAAYLFTGRVQLRGVVSATQSESANAS